MKFRTKLSILFVTMTLIPLLSVNLLVIQNVRESLLRQTIDQLRSVAQLQQHRVDEALERYLEQVRSVTSRTQLRISLEDFNTTAEQSHLDRIQRIIEDAVSSVRGFKAIAIYDLEGKLLVSTAELPEGEQIVKEDVKGQTSPELKELFLDETEKVRVRLLGPLILDSELVGILEIEADAGPIIAITEDHAGLGETGEVILARRNEAGDALFLTPLRFDAGASLQRAVSKEDVNTPMIPAINGKEVVLIDKMTRDYRGEQVFAVTQFVPALDWGLVAKIDRSEVLAPIELIEKVLFSLLFVTALVVFVIAIFIGRAIAKPIRLLTTFAKGLQKGNFSMRTKVETDDELGFLTETMNDMAARLEDLYKSLEKKVRIRTRQLEQEKAKDEAILASLGDGLVVTDSKGKIVLVNEAFEQLLGLKSEEVQGKCMVDMVPVVREDGKEVPKDQRPISTTLKTSKVTATSTKNTLYYKKADGSTFPAAITAAPVVYKGKLSGGVIVFRDITKETQIDQAKTEFVSLASHQLRTPLSAINWYTEMLIAGDAGKITKDQRKYLQEVYAGSQRMVELVNSLLDVSRLELGTFAVEPEEMEVKKIAYSVMDELKPQVDAKKMTLTANVAKDIPTVTADPKLFRMIVQNLLSNAVKYTPEKGKITLQVQLHKKGDSFEEKKITNESLSILVADTGYGIPKEQQGKIFTKLFRADNVKEEDTEGTGLGLYITKSVVEHMGGDIWFTSIEEKGTTFKVILPLDGMKKQKTGNKKLGS